MNTPRKINGVSATITAQLNAALAASRVRSCDAKNRYPDEFVARAVGTQQMSLKHTQLYIYKCKHCRGWHLTRSEQAPYWAADYFEKRDQ